MLIPFCSLVKRYGMQVSGVLHVGAHLGEEAECYDEMGVNNVVWIEGNPALIEPLTQNVAQYGHRVINALVSDHDEENVRFNITNNGQSSSLLEFGTHKVVSPDVHFIRTDILPTTTIDRLAEEHDFWDCNFLNMDLQGAELLALTGATGMIRNLEYIYTEINVDELYKGCVRLPELDAFLADFQRVDMVMAGNAGWGDAIYIRRH